MRMESPLNQRLRWSPPDVVYTPIDVTSRTSTSYSVSGFKSTEPHEVSGVSNPKLQLPGVRLPDPKLTYVTVVSIIHRGRQAYRLRPDPCSVSRHAIGPAGPPQEINQGLHSVTLEPAARPPGWAGRCHTMPPCPQAYRTAPLPPLRVSQAIQYPRQLQALASVLYFGVVTRTAPRRQAWLVFARSGYARKDHNRTPGSFPGELPYPGNVNAVPQGQRRCDYSSWPSASKRSSTWPPMLSIT